MIVATSHAIERYIERVKPALDPESAKRELNQLLEFADLQPEPPEFIDEMREADGWAVVGEGICFPIKNGTKQDYAVSCLVRGMLTEHQRERRNDRHRRRRERKKMRSAKIFNEQRPREAA